MVSYNDEVEERKVEVKRHNLARVNIGKLSVEQKLELFEQKKFKVI